MAHRFGLYAGRSFLALATLFVATAAADDTIHWVAAPETQGNWLQASNWSAPNATSFYEFRIDNGGTAVLGSGVVHGAAGRIGNQNSGRLIQNGGSLILDPSEGRGLSLGLDAGSVGVYDLVGGFAHMNALDLGFNGQGVLNVTGGELLVEQYFNVNSNGLVNQLGGVVTLKDPNGAGSMRVRGGDYNLSGTGRLEASFLLVEHDGEFAQSGGQVQGSINLIGSAARPSRYELNRGHINADSIDLRGSGSGIGTYFRQDGGRVDSGLVFVNGGEYALNAGILTTKELHVDSRAGQFGGDEAKMTIAGASLKVADVLRVGSDDGPVTFQMNGAAVDAHRLYAPAENATLIDQRGGSVVLDSLDIYAYSPVGGNLTYRMDGGSLVVERHARIAADDYGSGEMSARLDFAGSSGVFATGPGSRLEFGPNVSIVNAEHASMRVGKDSLLIAPASTDFDAVFGHFEHHNVVRYERGTVLHVGEGQSVQVGGLNTRDGFDVNGRLYRNPGFGETSSMGQFRVGPAGQVELRGRAQIIVENHEDAGIFGGSAEVNSLSVGRSGGSGNVRFTIDQGGTLDLTDTLHLVGQSGQTTRLDMVDGAITGNRIMIERNSWFQQTGGLVDVGTFSVEPVGGNRATVSGGELRAEYMGIHQAARLDLTGGVGSTEYLLIGGGTLALGPEAEFHIRRQFTTTTPPATVDFKSSGGTLFIEGALMDLQAGVPFVNGEFGHLSIDEHSLVVLPPEVQLASFVKFVDNDGLLHNIGAPLAIPADREIHGSGEIRLQGKKLDVYGKLLVDPTGGAYLIEQFEIHQGAEVNLGPKGQAFSDPQARASSMSGGVLRSGNLRVVQGIESVFRQSAGNATIGALDIQQGARYELSGGTLAFTNLRGAGVLDLANSSAEIQLEPSGFLEIDKFNFTNTAQSHLRGAADSLIVVPPDFDSGRFASFSSEGLIQVRGEDLTIPAGQTIGGLNVSIVGDVTNLGVLSPGMPEQIGTLKIDGDLNILGAGLLASEIGKNASGNALVADVFDVTGVARLGGILDVRILGELEPALGSEFRLLTASEGITGSFASLSLPSIDGLTFDLTIRENSLFLSVSSASSCLIGDTLPCDGAIDLNDLNNVRNAFGAGIPDGPRLVGDTFPFDGVVDLADLNAVRNQFGQQSTAMVPEPSGLAIGLIAVVALTLRRFRPRYAR